MTSRLYSLALAIDTVLLLVASGNVLVMYGSFAGMPDADGGLTDLGRLASWGVPLVLLALIGTAHALRARGAAVAATVLLWLPALPFGLSLLLWGGLAFVFALSGR